MEARLRIVIFLAPVLSLLIFGAPARAQFAEAVPPGQVQLVAPKDSPLAHAAAIGGAIGSPTYVMPKSSSSVISISPAFADWLQPYIDSITNLLIYAALGWAANWMRTHWKIDLDEKQRAAIVTALQNQAGSLIADGKVKITGGKIDVHNDALANAANELMRSVPDAAKHFGVTPDYVAARIVDTIPQIAAGAQMIIADAATGASQKLP